MGKTFDGIHRVSFWINPEGLIERIWTKVKPDLHTTEVIEAIKAFERTGIWMGLLSPEPTQLLKGAFGEMKA